MRFTPWSWLKSRVIITLRRIFVIGGCLLLLYVILASLGIDVRPYSGTAVFYSDRNYSSRNDDGLSKPFEVVPYQKVSSKDQLGQVNGTTLRPIQTDIPRYQTTPSKRKTTPSRDVVKSVTISPPDCPKSSPVLVKPVQDLKETHEFQRVNSGDLTFVYSAYLETRLSDLVYSIVILGISSNYYSNRGVYGFCALWFRDSEHPVYFNALFSFVPETHGKKYAASYHTCSFDHKTLGIPYAASFTFEKCVQPQNTLKVIHITDTVTDSQNIKENIYQDREYNRVNFTVCVTPITEEFNDAEHFVEWIECSRMFGAQRFVFYDYLIGDEVKKVIKHYADEGIVKLRSWKMPISNITKGLEPSMHYYGQVAALNDCLYRNTLSSRFIVFEDLDELIVSRRHDTWQELIDAVSSRSNNEINYAAVYSVRNVFFRNDWELDPNMTKVERVKGMNLQTLLTTKREANIFPHRSRSKYIVTPLFVRQVGIHFVYEFSPKSNAEVLLTPEDALVHHYRPTMWPESPDSIPKSQYDSYMHKFSHKIIDLVAHRRNKLKLSAKAQTVR